MFAGYEQNLAKAFARKMARFPPHLLEIERHAQDRIITRKTAIAAVVNAFIGKIKRAQTGAWCDRSFVDVRACARCAISSKAASVFGASKASKRRNSGDFFSGKLSSISAKDIRD